MLESDQAGVRAGAGRGHTFSVLCRPRGIGHRDLRRGHLTDAGRLAALVGQLRRVFAECLGPLLAWPDAVRRPGLETRSNRVKPATPPLNIQPSETRFASATGTYAYWPEGPKRRSFPSPCPSVTLTGGKAARGSPRGAAMSEPLYVPVLSVRQHARTAYERLRPDAQAAVTPLRNLPPCPGVSPEGLKNARWLKGLNRVRGAHRRFAGWVDAPSAEEVQVPALSEILSESMRFSRLLRPVTGPDRSELQQSAAIGTARGNGCGLGVRVRVPGEWDGSTTEEIGRLLAQTGPGVPVDLLLDLGDVVTSRPDAGKEALRALDTLLPPHALPPRAPTGSLERWHQRAVAGSATLTFVPSDVPRMPSLPRAAKAWSTNRV